MDRADILELSLSGIAQTIEKREISVAEVVDASLKRIRDEADRYAFISTYETESRIIAKAYDFLLDAGYKLGSLHGVPIAVKDNINMEGKITTAGSKIRKEFVPSKDATVVSKLKASGAIIVGKTNMHEFAWGGTTENPHYGFCRNAWDIERNPAGSSGGSGSAVASRCCYGALGTDTGGSVRLPSAINGITGIRPTIGRVSNHGVFAVAYSEDTVGPMCRSAEDCAIMLQAIAGHDYQDGMSAKVPVENYLADMDLSIDGIRLGIIKDYSMYHNQPDVEKCYEEALATMKACGAQVMEIELPDIDTLVDAQLIIDACEPSALHLNYLRNHSEDYGEDVRILLEAGCMFSSTQYIQALQYRRLIKSQIEEAFKRVDAIVTPTLPFTALKIGEHRIEIQKGTEENALSGNMRYTALPSLTGKPALSVPCGFDYQHLPVGLQIIGDSFRESLLFRIGNAYQKATSFHQMSPIK